MFEKLVSFTKKVSDLADKPSLNSNELKAQFDAAPDEVRTYLNKLVDALTKNTGGDSGAKNIGATNITGLTGMDVQTLLESLKSYADTKFALQSAVPVIQKGSASVTLANTDLVSKAITFPNAFSTVPKVFAIVDGQSTYFCGTASITTTGCTIYVRRTSILSGSETFTLNWMAIA
jgi:hypothetical protein